MERTGCRYLSEDEIYAAALEREPDASAERRAQLRTEAGKKARHNVAFYDAKLSVQKSVTLLHTAFEAREVAVRQAGDEPTAAAWGEFRAAVEDAIWAGNNAALELLRDKAGYTRVGHHGGAAGRYADAHELAVASFFQHDSRDPDPQLHVYNTILNRVEGPDGVWRTVDGRSLHPLAPGRRGGRGAHDRGVPTSVSRRGRPSFPPTSWPGPARQPSTTAPPPPCTVPKPMPRQPRPRAVPGRRRRRRPRD
ncbi:relaxase domain-containing protein [Pseudonocardia sp. ICBG1142]|uniref:relaxase domain-containing protein n=1 Tax=Pseudonocardia sp. ICBG1142 TaxID=2846760 RepID=UPI001CF70B32|nr:relaxase domain-containing protein [Pseudonocardia sp. ICBG1142]